MVRSLVDGAGPVLHSPSDKLWPRGVVLFLAALILPMLLCLALARSPAQKLSSYPLPVSFDTSSLSRWLTLP